MTEKKPEHGKNRFILEEEDVRITGERKPDPEEIAQANRVFGEILKNTKKKE